MKLWGCIETAPRRPRGPWDATYVIQGREGLADLTRADWKAIQGRLNRDRGTCRARLDRGIEWQIFPSMRPIFMGEGSPEEVPINIWGWKLGGWLHLIFGPEGD
jgi:hypothetical protein